LNPRTLSFATKAAYGTGQLAEGVKTTAFNVFLLFYYNQVLGLSAWWTGLALGVATVIDAIADPMMGSISDSTRHRWGRRHPYLYGAAVPLGVTLALLFSPPVGLEGASLFAWLITFTVLVRLSMSAYAVPHLALGAELSSDYRERTSIVAYRNFLAYVGAVLVVVSGWGYFFRSEPGLTDGQFNRAAYPEFGLFCAIAATLSVLVSALGTHNRIPYMAVAHDAAPLSVGRLWGEMRETLANPSFRALFFGIVLFFITRGVAEGLGIYLFTHFWETPPSAILQVQATGLIGVLVGTVLWVMLSRAIDKKPAFLVGMIVFTVFTLLPPLAKIWGWFPAAANPLYVPTLASLQFVAALGAAAALVTSGSMMADIADEHELNTGRRQEGIFFGALIFAVKVTSGLGQFFAGWGLDLIGFPDRAAPGTVPTETINALAFLYGPGLSVIAVVAIAILWRYRIDRRRHEEIMRALLERRAAAVASLHGVAAAGGGVVA
jgi:glycoside/pentoside/hexuronide:cation symporter, GPH family